MRFKQIGALGVDFSMEESAACASGQVTSRDSITSAGMPAIWGRSIAPGNDLAVFAQNLADAAESSTVGAPILGLLPVIA